jgi:hypothetical protein
MMEGGVLPTKTADELFGNALERRAGRNAGKESRS